MVGIYCIENIDNNKKYIGQSRNIEERKRKHFNKLKNNKHDNKHLQASYNIHGKDSFIFYVIEECELHELNEREIYWIDFFNSYKNGYNSTYGGEGISGWKADDAFKEKMKQIVSGENNPNYGNKWTDEMKKHASERMKGKYSNENNPNAKSIICVEKLKIYKTIKEATIDCNCKSETSITRCLKNYKFVANNYHFILYTDCIYKYLLKNQFKYLCKCYEGKNIIADITNQKFYKKYELKNFLYKTTEFKTREIDEILKQKYYQINNIQYVLL